jgi:hypothetical protein
MTRTTIMADEGLLERLRQIAREEGTSLAETIRQALEWRVKQPRPRPRFIGAGASRGGTRDTARKSAHLTAEPRSWR